ncbi:MAG: TerC family protein, partial [Flavobacteriales bacterium]
IMICAVLISMFVMMSFAGKIAKFIAAHPTLEVLALSFLILIGFMLILDAAGQNVPKGYIYFAVFFSMGVEMININLRKKKKKKK